ncbi:dipeptidase [Membranihabitans marinus]|uniref:dipeptidase n=1 Tax=Membranihabitans marinus TaxID=1227546 RepID=UPI001F193ED9|nr:membrane dipeptidase [Membranihabitans marinus]
MKDKQARRKFLKGLGVTGSVFSLAPMTMDNLWTPNIQSKSNTSKPNFVTSYNKTIDEAREVALDILKPSKRDLEHGLELHRASIVFDTYGFMPRSAYDGDAIAQLVNSGASLLEINNMKEDHSMTRMVSNAIEYQEVKLGWEASGVTCVFQNTGEESNTIKVLLKRLARFMHVTDSIPKLVQKALTVEDIRLAKSEGRHALCFSGNGVPMALDMTSLEEELEYIRIFYQLGIRMMHLTYNRRNLIGDGCGETSDGGLSDFGRAVVKRMNEQGVIVDIAHSGWQTSLEAAQLSTKPMVASHTTATSLKHHIRSKPDNVIRAIADTDGYVGICSIPRFLGGKGDISVMLDHIDYVAKKFGPQYVGIGTDVPYSSSNFSVENAKIPKYRGARTRWEALWPEDPFKETHRMRQSMLWTNWPLFTVGLVQRGYSDDDIQKMIGGNALRVLSANSQAKV